MLPSLELYRLCTLLKTSTLLPTPKVSVDGHSRQVDAMERRYLTPTPIGHFAMHDTPYDFIQAAGPGPTDAADQRRIAV